MSNELQQLQQLANAAKKLRALEMRDAIDPLRPDSRPTAGQEEVLQGLAIYRRLYVFGGNRSGKTMLAGRVAAYFLNRDCPYLDINARWPGKPMLILVIARTSEHYTEIWEKKIQPFLAPGSYKEEKVGGVLQRVRHRENGGKIIFLSHHNPYEAREKVQMFGAHLVIFDEQTDHLPLLEEAIRRTVDEDGIFFNSMTPKIPAPAVKKYIDKTHRHSKIFKLRMLDNPVFKGREQDILDDIKNLPTEMQATILEGDWYQAEGKVYYYNPEFHRKFPAGYSVSWRHAEAVDPAASGKVGFGIFAEDPNNGDWYCIRAKYLKGEAPTDLLDKILEETEGLNITHRVADPHESWFMKQARKAPYNRYYAPVLKDGRKDELIKGVSEALKTWLRLAPTGCESLEEEFGDAEWSPDHSGKIVNGTKYHLLDMLQYFVDTKPKYVPSTASLDVLTLLSLANRDRKRKEAVQAAAKKSSFKRLRPAFRRRSR